MTHIMISEIILLRNDIDRVSLNLIQEKLIQIKPKYV